MGAGSSKAPQAAQKRTSSSKTSAEGQKTSGNAPNENSMVVFSDFSSLLSKSDNGGSSSSVPNNNTLNRINEQDRAMLDLKVQRDKLKRYQTQLQSIIEREKTVAKNYLASGSKEKALAVLKKKRKQETLLSSTEKNLFTLEDLVMSVEFKKIQNQVYAGLRTGTDLLKKLHQEVSVEDVENLVEESNEMKQLTEEMTDLLSSHADASEEDQSLLEELQRLSESSHKPKVDLKLSTENTIETDHAVSSSSSPPQLSAGAESVKKKKVLLV